MEVLLLLFIADLNESGVPFLPAVDLRSKGGDRQSIGRLLFADESHLKSRDDRWSDEQPEASIAYLLVGLFDFRSGS